MVQAVCRTALAPLADGLGGDAIALGEDAAALVRAGDLGTGDGCGAGVRMDLQHRSDLPLTGLHQTFKQVAVGGNSMPDRVPTMFRDLTASSLHAPMLPIRPVTECIRAALASVVRIGAVRADCRTERLPRRS